MVMGGAEPANIQRFSVIIVVRVYRLSGSALLAWLFEQLATSHCVPYSCVRPGLSGVPFAPFFLGAPTGSLAGCGFCVLPSSAQPLRVVFSRLVVCLLAFLAAGRQSINRCCAFMEVGSLLCCAASVAMFHSKGPG
jgi:hypothetical protein